MMFGNLFIYLSVCLCWYATYMLVCAEGVMHSMWDPLKAEKRVVVSYLIWSLGTELRSPESTDRTTN